MINNDRDFLSSLPRDLHKQYKQKKASLIKDIVAKWSDDQLVARKNTGIELDVNHTRILNACVFPFVQQNNITQKLNYAYIKSSPLSEVGVKNVDFLIASKTDGVLIFGEAKGKITDPREVIAEYKERIKIINENSTYIEEMFPSARSWEYVLGVPSDRASETSKAIIRSNTNIILWQVGTWSGNTLSLVVPDTDKTARQKIIHDNNDLNKEIRNQGIPTSTNFRTFYHESHPVAKISVLTLIDKERFTFNDLKLHVNHELDNTSDTEITLMTEQILDWAIDIGFVRSLDDGTYKIQSRFKHADVRYDDLKTKWIKRRIECEKELDFKQKLKELQAQFSAQLKSLNRY